MSNPFIILLNIISKCIFLKSLVSQGSLLQLLGKVAMAEVKSKGNTSSFKHTGRKQGKAFAKIERFSYSIRALIQAEVQIH